MKAVLPNLLHARVEAKLKRRLLTAIAVTGQTQSEFM